MDELKSVIKKIAVEDDNEKFDGLSLIEEPPMNWKDLVKNYAPKLGVESDELLYLLSNHILDRMSEDKESFMDEYLQMLFDLYGQGEFEDMLEALVGGG